MVTWTGYKLTTRWLKCNQRSGNRELRLPMGVPLRRSARMRLTWHWEKLTNPTMHLSHVPHSKVLMFLHICPMVISVYLWQTYFRADMWDDKLRPFNKRDNDFKWNLTFGTGIRSTSGHSMYKSHWFQYCLRDNHINLCQAIIYIDEYYHLTTILYRGGTYSLESFHYRNKISYRKISKSLRDTRSMFIFSTTLQFGRLLDSPSTEKGYELFNTNFAGSRLCEILRWGVLIDVVMTHRSPVMFEL